MRIKALTYIELLTVMIIGSIVVSMAYRSYFTFQKTTVAYTKSSNKSINALDLYSSLYSRFFDAESIKFNGNALVCYTNNDSCIFHFRKDFVVRSYHSRNDTFHIKCSGRELRFEPETDLINEFKIELEQGGHSRKLALKKNYSLEQVMTYNEP